ncbi:secondary thiamine-phosphate synthase enzyme YjbQ [Prochlorococcus sp. MIT 1307]|uniref:secondary thiamine-phosphate synthase enzyme YjbQ n=1 Tax=Prochlorococcus sp. MIT 1307 TaxID=3096219 RepID=UPI002A74D383|nr:secondary thiamine-phosphate synthase enzyme YjbQ [Prochlorococcus sp. MIT 1307]
MKQILSELSIETPGEGFIDITSEINKWIIKNKFHQGILVLFTKHTSCSLTINENADPRVLEDLSSFMKALVPEEGVRKPNHQGQFTLYRHNEEGVDDMPAHIRTTLTCSSLSLSINEKKLVLGTWQAIYLWEHRYSRHSRKLYLHAIGEVEEDKATFFAESNATLTARTNASKPNEVVRKRHNSEVMNKDKDSTNTNFDLLNHRIQDPTNKADSITPEGMQ